MTSFRAVFAACLALGILVACTPGAPPPPGGAQGPVPGAVIIEASLLKYAPQQTTAGTVAGYSNADLIVPVGAVVQFHNQDDFAHTASFLSTTGFPPAAPAPLTDAARSPSGSDLAQAGWSTGDLGADAYSRPFTASKAGTYYYGCFFHYGTPMRGRITVR